ncbi:MAG TPA: T9SS type A sorting domain-containing protein [Bacteroidia bacterium]|nr:T9SS type A sorting domain-containing protein [Bacteroidia bacterium]
MNAACSRNRLSSTGYFNKYDKLNTCMTINPKKKSKLAKSEITSEKRQMKTRSIVILIALLITAFHTGFAQTYALLGAGCNDKVYTIAPDPSNPNGIYAGGAFINAGGNPVNYVAKWNGSVWSPLNGGTNFVVRSILSQSPTEIYIGGAFSLVGSPQIASWGVAKWNGSAWSAMGNGIRGDVYALTNFNSNLYAGGAFDTLNGFNPARGILTWNGTDWVPLGGSVTNSIGGPAGFKVKALIEFNGSLYAGGSFTTAGGAAAANIARWNGTSWSAIGSGTDGEVNAFAVYNGELYVGGAFTTADGVQVNGIAKISGNTFVAVGSGLNGTVNSLTVFSPYLYLTGAFTTAGGVPAQNIARINGATWYNVGLGLNFDGYCLTQQNTDLYIGGLFTVAGTIFPNNICKITDPALGLHDASDIIPFSIAPNPTSGELNIFSETNDPVYSYRVSDICGKEVIQGSTNGRQKVSLSLDMQFLNPGTYFLTLITGKGEFTRTVILY